MTQLKSGLGQIDGLTSPTINAATSYKQAATISAQKVSVTTDSTGEPTPPIQFVQNNTSPTALSEIEIYRQTKNQLSQAKNLLASK